MWGRQCPLCDPHTRICPVLWSNRHRSFNSARGNKAFWPNGHLKGDATTNTLISYGYSGIWWRLLHNTANACPQLDAWIAQTLDCIDPGDTWFIAYKINRLGWFVAVPETNHGYQFDNH